MVTDGKKVFVFKPTLIEESAGRTYLFIIKINAIPMVARIKNLRKKYPVFFFISLFQSVFFLIYFIFSVSFLFLLIPFSILYTQKRKRIKFTVIK